MNKIYITLTILVLAFGASLALFLNKNEDHKEISIENPASIDKQQEKPTQEQKTEESVNDETNKNEVLDNQSPSDSSQLQHEIESRNETHDSETIQKQSEENMSFIQENFVSWGFANSSGRKIDTIIIHSSYDALGDEPYDVNGILEVYKMYGVSAHYIIDRGGRTYQLVHDEDISYHAGASSVPDGRTNVNNFSIGIEMVNTKKDEYASAQYESLNKLIDLLSKKYKIAYILGHNEIAPERKDDPWNFDWDKIDARK